MKLSYCVIILGLVGLIGFASSCTSKSNPAAPVSDTSLLQGVWSGKLLGDDQNPVWTITFSNDTAIAAAGTQIYFKGLFNVTEKNNVKNIDVIISESSIAPEYVGKTSLGVYQINKDTLKYAADEPGSLTRPASINGDSTSMVFVLVKK